MIAPPYDVLDDILNCLVELEMPVPAIVARGHAPELVKKVERMLYLAEYKRRQAPIGIRVCAIAPGTMGTWCVLWRVAATGKVPA